MVATSDPTGLVLTTGVDAGWCAPGAHQIEWSGALAAGVYVFVRRPTAETAHTGA